jgi:hypothetical protein
MYTFELHRDVDETGVSGTGVVAQGVAFDDGTVALRWLGNIGSTVIYAHMADVERIHGHNGQTRIVATSARAIHLDPYGDRPDPLTNRPLPERVPGPMVQREGMVWHSAEPTYPGTVATGGLQASGPALVPEGSVFAPKTDIMPAGGYRWEGEPGPEVIKDADVPSGHAYAGLDEYQVTQGEANDLLPPTHPHGQHRIEPSIPYDC